jgi:hypothetical protein
MKTFLHQHENPGRHTTQGRQAHTLVEMMVSVGVFSLVVVALVYAHLFGLRQNELVISKLGASDQSRSSFDKLAHDIRSAKMWDVGNGDEDSFTAIPNGSSQQGTALQLNLTTDTSKYIRYFFDTQKQELRRIHSGDTESTLIAEHLTNTMYFRAEDYRGNVQTDLNHKGVINVKLQFYQYQYPITRVGPGNYYDFYKMEFKVTPHVPDGP